MGAKSVLITIMLVLTAIVVSCVGRIEYLNALGGHVLPRLQREGVSGTWDVANLDEVLEYLDNQFHRRRRFAARADAEDRGEPEPEAVSRGAPYSQAEQRSIDTAKYQIDVLTRLRWCIQYLGWPQYFIAPIALLLCVVCGMALKGWSHKAISVGCAGLCCTGIVLVLMRGYWDAFG